MNWESAVIFLDGLIEKLRKRSSGVSEFWLKSIGKRLRKLKGLDPSDAAGIAAIRNDTTLISDLEDVLRAAGQDTVQDAKALLKTAARLSADAAPVAKDLAMDEWISGIAEAAQGDLANITGTSVVAVVSPEGVVSPREAYLRAVDEVTAQLASGEDGLKQATRKVCEQFADAGLSVVEYESGRVEELGAATERNLKQAVHEVYQGVQRRVGQEYGADGVEISAHADCAPDHLEIQGLQFTNEEYEKVNGALRRKIGTWNCRHVVYSIIVGVTPPTYSPEELAEMRAKATAVQEFDGKQMTVYEATQAQRKLEREIRRQKNRTIIAKAAGDDEMRREAQMKINQLNGKYKELSDAFGLKTQAQRTAVSGYRPVKVENSPLDIKGSASKIPSNTDIIGIGEMERSRLLPGADASAIVSDAIGTKSYAEKIRKLGESEKVSNIMTFQARATLWRRNGTPYEDLIYINPGTKEWKTQRLQDIAGGVSPTEEMKKMALDSPRSIIAMHNHPHNMLPSYDDLMNARYYKYGVIACHNGAVIKYSVSDNADLSRCDRILNLMQGDFEKGADLSYYAEMLDRLGVHMEIL